jgi:hypothetical protein
MQAEEVTSVILLKISYRPDTPIHIVTGYEMKHTVHKAAVVCIVQTVQYLVNDLTISDIVRKL